MYSTKQRYSNAKRPSEDGISMMRKVRSLDSVRLHGLEFKGGWSKPSSTISPKSTRDPHRFIELDKASKFSRYTAGERYVVHFA